MFEKTNKKEGNYVDSLGMTNRIVEGTVIKGDMEAIADLRIDGRLTGNLTVKGRVVIGPNAAVIGDITCDNCDVEGIVEGIITVGDLLHLKANAKLKGQIVVGRLAVEPGALLDVKCQMVGTK